MFYILHQTFLNRSAQFDCWTSWCAKILPSVIWENSSSKALRNIFSHFAKPNLKKIFLGERKNKIPLKSIIRHAGITKETQFKGKWLNKSRNSLEGWSSFSKATFSVPSESSLICSFFHVFCGLWKRKQESPYTAADLPLFGRHNGIIGASGQKLEKQHAFTDRLSLTYVSLSASHSPNNTG